MSENGAEVEETEEEYDNPGISGQILYPEVEVDAERAGAYAAGDVETLYDDPDDERNSGWRNPADRSSEVEEPDEGEGEADGE